MAIPGVEFGDRVVDTWGAWSLPEQPKRLAVVGAGASGSEIASAYVRYGTEVTLVEMLPQILPLEDKDMARVVERTFKKQGIEILTGTPISDVEAGAKSVKAKVGDQEIEVDYLAIAGGRAPDTEGLGLDAAGVKTGDGGKIEIDEYQRTSNPKVYAIGDLVRGPALAHKASEEGVVAVETIAGAQTHPVDVDLVPGATFCHPQVASVGMTEAEAKERAKESGREVKVGKFKLGGVGASAVYDDREGMVKIVADAEFGEILGAHIVGNRACDMIAELVDTIALEGGYQELARIVHRAPDDLRGRARRGAGRRRLGDARLVDYDALREGMAAAVPFNRHLGLEITEIGDGFAVVRPRCCRGPGPRPSRAASTRTRAPGSDAERNRTRNVPRLPGNFAESSVGPVADEPPRTLVAALDVEHLTGLRRRDGPGDQQPALAAGPTRLTRGATVTTPFICTGWTSQKYSNVPASKTRSRVSPGPNPGGLSGVWP